jgi:hypothetical protein
VNLIFELGLIKFQRPRTTKTDSRKSYCMEANAVATWDCPNGNGEKSGKN